MSLKGVGKINNLGEPNVIKGSGENKFVFLLN